MNHEHQSLTKGERLVIPGDALVFVVDDSGDEQLKDPAHPFLAFGGVAYVGGAYEALARDWRNMKSATFPQLRGALHAKRHLRERATAQLGAVLRTMRSPDLGRFGAVITDATAVPLDRVALVTLRVLANRLANVAAGMMSRGLWRPPAPVYAVFEHSTRLTNHIERAFDGIRLVVGEDLVPIEGCFMEKRVSDPFLEMADVIVNAVTRSVRYQRALADPRACTPAFQALFRDVGPPMASYIEVTAVQ